MYLTSFKVNSDQKSAVQLSCCLQYKGVAVLCCEFDAR